MACFSSRRRLTVRGAVEEGGVTDHDDADVAYPRLLTAEELAAWLGVSVAVVYKEARAGRIPGRQVGREWRFLLDAVVEWFHHPDDRAPIDTPPLEDRASASLAPTLDADD